MFFGLKAKEIVRKSQMEQFLKENTEQIHLIKEAMSEVGFNLTTAEIGKLFMDADAAGLDINTYLRSRLGFKVEDGDKENVEDAPDSETEKE